MGDVSYNRKAIRSPNVDPNDKKYLHCVRPLETRKRKLSGGKNSESLRVY
jgi:hypothetical protein